MFALRPDAKYLKSTSHTQILYMIMYMDMYQCAYTLQVPGYFSFDIP